MLDFRRGIHGFWSDDHNRSGLATADDGQEHQNCKRPNAEPTTRLTEETSQKPPGCPSAMDELSPRSKSSATISLRNGCVSRDDASSEFEPHRLLTLLTDRGRHWLEMLTRIPKSVSDQPTKVNQPARGKETQKEMQVSQIFRRKQSQEGNAGRRQSLRPTAGVQPAENAGDERAVPTHHTDLARISRLHRHSGPVAEVRPGVEPDPRPYHERVLPKHLQTIE